MTTIPDDEQTAMTDYPLDVRIRAGLLAERMTGEFMDANGDGFATGNLVIAIVCAAIAEERERCAAKCREQIKTFLSEGYSSGTPRERFENTAAERWACIVCADEIMSEDAALKELEALPIAYSRQ